MLMNSVFGSMNTAMLLSEARISGSSLLHNLNYLRAAGGGKPTICVVKANAYGHGVSVKAGGTVIPWTALVYRATITEGMP